LEEAAPMKLCLIALISAMLLGPVSENAVPGKSIGAPEESLWEEAPQSGEREWLGADGEALPFRTDEEILEFLRTAEIASTEKIPVGVTAPRKALLEKGGIQAHATFKDIDETAKRVRLSDGTYVMELRDYYMYEIAAYELSLLLGLDNVPPTVTRKPGRNEGSLQMWIEESMTEDVRREQGLRAPDIVRWMQQVQTMYLFDDLIGNVDRNQGDILIDSDWKLWMVDHSRSFGTRFEPSRLAQVISCERGFWEKLQTLDEAQIREKLGHSLTGPEIEAMLERRDTLVAHIQQLIDQRTEEVVLYDRQ